jgi:hypothetical protein
MLGPGLPGEGLGFGFRVLGKEVVVILARILW